MRLEDYSSSRRTLRLDLSNCKAMAGISHAQIILQVGVGSEKFLQMAIAYGQIIN